MHHSTFNRSIRFIRTITTKMQGFKILWMFMLFGSNSGRQRISPVQEISPSSETSRLSVGSVTQSAIDVERMSPDSHQNQDYSLYSPDDLVPVTSSRNHKCRYCNYATTSYTQLQFHLAKHGGKLFDVCFVSCQERVEGAFRKHLAEYWNIHLVANSVVFLDFSSLWNTPVTC